MRGQSQAYRWWAPLAVIVVILAANGAYLTRRTTANPLATDSLLVVSRTNGYLPGFGTIDPNIGITNQAIGHTVASDWLSGHLPSWDSNQAAGVPLLASPQSAAFNPLTLLDRSSHGIYIELVILELIAGLSTYFLARRLRITTLVAVFAGIAFGLNGTFAWLQGGPSLAAPFIPLALLGIERALSYSATRRRGGWALLAVALGLMAQSGFVEAAYIGGFLIGGWSLLRLFTLPREVRWSFVAKVAAGGVGGGLLAAPLLLPVANYVPGADVGAHAGVFSKLTLTAHALPQLMGLPYAYGPIFAFDNAAHQISNVWDNVGGFVSAALVVLALIGLFGRRLRGLRVVLGACILFFLAKTFGPHALVDLINHVPGMYSVAFYRYMNPALELAVIVLAALGLDDLVKKSARRYEVVIAAALALVMFVGGYLIASRATRAIPDATRAARWSLAWAIAIAVVIVVISLVRDDRLRTWGLVAVGVVDVALCFGVPTLSAPKSYAMDTSSVTWLRRHVGLERVYTFGPIAPNYGTYFNVPLASLNEIPTPQLWTDFLISRLGPTVNALDIANTPASQALMMAHPDALRQLAVGYVIVHRGTVLPADFRAQLTLAHQDSVADVYALKGPETYFAASDPRCRISAGSRTKAEITCPRPATLVRREMYFDGWDAQVNGHDAAIRKSDFMFQSVPVPAGRSTVAFAYHTPDLGLGALGGLAGAVWILLGVILAELKRRRDGASVVDQVVSLPSGDAVSLSGQGGVPPSARAAERTKRAPASEPSGAGPSEDS